MTFSNLKKLFGDRVNALTTLSVNSKTANVNQTYPFLDFIFESTSFPYGNLEHKIVTVDYWDNKKDSSTITAQADLIKAGLNWYWYSGAEGFYRSEIIFEGEIIDENPNISRYQQRYLLKVR